MASIAIYCDGTWNSADKETENGEPCVTNVLKLAVRTAKHKKDGTLQMVYYDQGVGTGNAVDKLIGGTTGEGLEANVLDAYRFLVANYEPGDDVYIFGFSRGAYTARCIGGLVSRCGILDRKHVRQYGAALKLFHAVGEGTQAEAVQFRKQFAIEESTPIRCLGVWDTVGALGIPLRAFEMANKEKYEFLDVRLSRAVKFAFHALAVDEHRKPFAPTLWNWQGTPPDAGQTIEQVWFSGAHSDVGGGYAETGLSDIALKWMMAAAQRAGLEFDEEVVKILEPKNAVVMVHPSRTIKYKLTSGNLDREIGKTNFKTEYFHKSLVQRWGTKDKDGNVYRPASLVPFAAKIEALQKTPLNAEIYPVS